MRKTVKWSMIRARLGEGALCGACVLFLATAGFSGLHAQATAQKNLKELRAEKQRGDAEEFDQRETGSPNRTTAEG